MSEFKDLVGKILAAVEVNDREDIMTFVVSNEEKYQLYHSQDCCESVSIEDIIGDLANLVGTPIVEAEEAESGENPPDATPGTILYQDSFTWTFYKIRTAKGDVTIRWYGSSNGYYSERVDFVRVLNA